VPAVRQKLHLSICSNLRVRLYTIYEGVVGKFSFWSMIGGVFWGFLGFHLIYRFYLMAEIVRQHDEKAMLAHSLAKVT
jgi:glucose-6-phosphate isomerase